MPDWGNINEYVLLGVLSYLPCKDILHSSLACKRWLWISRNDCLWRTKIRERLSEVAASRLSPGTSSWMEEYRRMVEAVPRSEAGQSSSEHYGVVSHLAFSADGQLMASCGEDARSEVINNNETGYFYGHVLD